MAEKKLPVGVGKKIVEALKKQSEIDAEINAEAVSKNEIVEENEELNSIDEINSYDEIQENTSDEINDLDLNQIEQEVQDIVNEPLTFENSQTPNYTSAPAFEQMPNFEPAQGFDPQNNFESVGYEQQNVQFQNYNQNNYTQYNQPIKDPQSMGNYGERIMSVEQEHKTYTMPANVAVLRKLIAQLPTGVTKQTGAQIIRQTMEALGISMNSLLTEAQRYQDDLNNSIKDCMTTVNEYKQNIMTLEKQVIDYQKQAKSFNDLISLFIMTDK